MRTLVVVFITSIFLESCGQNDEEYAAALKQCGYNQGEAYRVKALFSTWDHGIRYRYRISCE